MIASAVWFPWMCLAYLLAAVLGMYEWVTLTQYRTGLPGILGGAMQTVLEIFMTGFLLMNAHGELHWIPMDTAASAAGTAWFYGLLVLLVVFFLMDLVMLRGSRKYLASHITPISLREAINDLESGVCFCTEDDIPVLVNRAMQEISRALTGGDLRNAGNFWRCVMEQGRPSGTDYLLDFPEGKVMRFRRRQIPEGFFEITASDVTELTAVTNALKEENARLAQMNLLLREYSERIDEVVKEEELINARIQIHDDLGSILLYSRRFIESEGQGMDRGELLSAWHQAISLLRQGGRERTVLPDIISELSSAAEALGIELQIIGDLPRQEDAVHLIFSGARECLTNAAHAGARHMTLRVNAQPRQLQIIYSNDGAEPEYPIHPGGGLSTLRSTVERAGASMRVARQAPFFLELIIPNQQEVF